MRSVTETGQSFVSQAGELAPGAGGAITLTGIVSPAITTQRAITAAASIGTAAAARPAPASLAILRIDLPPEIAAQPVSQTLQYSDLGSAVSITGTDVAGDALTLTTAWGRVDGQAAPGLPPGLVLTPAGCEPPGSGHTACRWTLAGPMGLPSGPYVVTATIADNYGLRRAAALRYRWNPKTHRSPWPGPTR